MSDWPEGVDRRVYPTLDSTMAEAARLAPGLGRATWLLALEQTGGRGRRGRDWLHPAGNFAATLIWRPTGPVAGRARYSFVAALALMDALVAVCGRADIFSLKWPNDVLLNSGKLAGILLESIGDHLLIGIGVNLMTAPAQTALEPRALAAVSLRQKIGLAIGPEAFLDLLAPAFAAREAQFVTGGFSSIRRDWLSRAAHLGQRLTARLPSGDVSGVFQTVDADGLLVLNAPDGVHHIPAAEIFLPERKGPGHAACH